MSNEISGLSGGGFGPSFNKISDAVHNSLTPLDDSKGTTSSIATTGAEEKAITISDLLHVDEHKENAQKVVVMDKENIYPIKEDGNQNVDKNYENTDSQQQEKKEAPVRYSKEGTYKLTSQGDGYNVWTTEGGAYEVVDEKGQVISSGSAGSYQEMLKRAQNQDKGIEGKMGDHYLSAARPYDEKQENQASKESAAKPTPENTENKTPLDDKMDLKTAAGILKNNIAIENPQVNFLGDSLITREGLKEYADMAGPDQEEKISAFTDKKLKEFLDYTNANPDLFIDQDVIKSRWSKDNVTQLVRASNYLLNDEEGRKGFDELDNRALLGWSGRDGKISGKDLDTFIEQGSYVSTVDPELGTMV